MDIETDPRTKQGQPQVANSDIISDAADDVLIHPGPDLWSK